MVKSVHSPTYSTFINQLLSLDKEISAKIHDNSKNVNEVYQIYLERLSLFEKSCLIPLSETDKSLLQSIKEDLYLEFKLYNLKTDMESQFDSIQSELHELEKHL